MAREMENPSALKKIIDRESREEEAGSNWREGIRKFEGKAEEMIKGHDLVEKARKNVKDLVKEHGTIQHIPKEIYDKISDETGYQAELIAAIYEKVWRETERRTLH